MSNPALLVVDVQNGFVNDDTKHIVPDVQDLIGQYDNLYATRFINAGEESPYVRFMGWTRFLPGSDDIQLAVKVPENCVVIDKYVYTCVDESFLRSLKERGIDEVHICGIDTDICVTKCAVDLFEHGIRPVVLSRYCASHGGQELHDAALKILKRYIGKDQIK
ncbi:cysteine hydrolase [Thalassospira sp. HF15]|uniref:cysteine hydrolase family protein n=1 Tax=Thalassospira sp. HF15 TaxID=2722755 RepID=UPI00142FCCD8|nr:isochorismatase family cysteine hydrolase [Thalassospira sp. HF15]NIY75862.1 cysteine hydrolase [Thalassospira sp. HF15]